MHAPNAQLPIPAPTRPLSLSSATLIMLGKADSRTALLPLLAQHPDAELWTLNDFYPRHRLAELRDLDLRARAVRHFEIHHPDCNLDEPDYAGFSGTVMISPFVWSSHPQEKPFPIYRVHEEFGHAYFESTIDYMLALALLLHRRGEQKLERICLPGVEMSDPAHFALRSGCNFWLGIAVGMGIEIVRPAASTMLKVQVDMQGRRDPADCFPHAYGQPWHITEPHAKALGWA